MQLVCQLRHRQRHLGDFVRGLRLIFFRLFVRWNAIEHRFTSEMETQGHIRHADTPDANLFCVSYHYIETICFADLDMSGMSSRETPCRSGDFRDIFPDIRTTGSMSEGLFFVHDGEIGRAHV